MKPASDTSPPWSSIAPYLDRALDLEPRERERWLTEVTTTQPEIGKILRAMLARHALLDAQGFLEQPAIESPEPAAQAGKRVGAYTLDKLIGRGGMGEVWLATRSDGRYEGRCAIKFLSSESTRGQQAERFAREGQLLGRLTHPNIARLLDAGSTDDGRSYLALEYVEGMPIDRYCETNSLGLDARLRLFLDVLSAVTHAQDHLVVHRDIKPSNVLVTKEGVVKLLDFGVAKLLENANLSGYGMLTRESAAALTPAYAAPEQLTSGSITTATDVYALGVLLYVLLSGRHPIATKTHSPAEMVNGILHVVPLPLSFGSKGVDGDLETIVAKALKKSPTERYNSANAFADDVRRYLSHQPINARPDSTLYRFRKFVRRNRLPVAAGFVLILGLTVALFAVNRERMIAERRFEQLRSLSSKIFELDKSLVGVTGSATARQKIVTASLEYLQGLEREVHDDLNLAYTIADGYWRIARIQGVPVDANMGEFAKADQSLSIAEKYITTVRSARPNDASALVLYGTIAHDRMILADLDKRGGDAIAFTQRALESFDRFLTSDDGSAKQKSDALTSYANIGLTYINYEKYDTAISVLNRLLEYDRSSPDPDFLYRSAAAQSLLANAYRLQGNIPAALETIRIARDNSESVSYRNEISRMTQLYAIYLREGMIVRDAIEANLAPDLDASVPFQKAFDITEAYAQLDPKDANSRNRLATATRELGFVVRERDPRKALHVYDVALRRTDETPDSVRKSRSQAELLAYSSYPLRSLKQHAESRRRIERAIALLHATKDLPADSIDLDGATFAALAAEAEMKAESGALPDAIDEYRLILDKAKFKTVEATPQSNLRSARRIADLYRRLAELHARNGNDSEAERVRALHRDLAQHWERKLPGNPITRTLAVQSSH